MLCGKNDLGYFRSLTVLVTHGYLALGIRSELAWIAFALVAGFCEFFENLVRIIDRSWHEIRGFTAGIAEHDALIASTFFALTVGCVVHALRDVGGLWVQKHIDLGRAPVETVLFITDFADRLASRRTETGRIDQRMARLVVSDRAVLILLQESLRHTHFAGNNHTIGGGERFACNANRPGSTPVRRASL